MLNKNVPIQGRVAGGVKGIDLVGDDYVITATQTYDDTSSEVIIATSFGTFKKVFVGTITKTARACKGVKICDLGDAKLDECVVLAQVIKSDENALLTVVDRIGAIYYIDALEIPQDSRTTKGRYISKIGPCQPLVVYCALR